MKKEDSSRRSQIRDNGFSLEKNVETGLGDINHLIKVLGKHIEFLERAYKKKDHKEFNILKKHVLEIQRRIHSLIN